MAISTPFLGMFSRSPIRPIVSHMTKVIAGVENLMPFMRAVYAEDWEQASELRDTIAQFEREADEMKRDFRIHLPGGLFMPVPRTDLLSLMTVQDSVVNRAKDLAGVILGRKLNIPPQLTTTYDTYLARCVDASHQAEKAIKELEDLMEVAFRGKEVSVMEKIIIELDKIEHDTDEMQIELRSQLFGIEKTLAPVNVIFLYKVIEWTGELADRAQNVGDQLLLLIAR